MRVIGVLELAQFIVLVGVLFVFTLAVSLILALAWDYFRQRLRG